MTLANIGWDLQSYSDGRFIMGLGSQIKPHITKRFSMPWSHPAARMREMILAIRAIWACWNDDVALDFRGEFYRHTLMTPFFSPGRNPHGAPPIYLAAVGPKMTAVAAEVADGLFVHPFTTTRYLGDVTIPALERSLAAAGRERSAFTICLPAFIATGATGTEIDEAVQRARRQVAFYGSTPVYRRVLDVHGWSDLQPKLNALSKRGAWDEMTSLIDDEVLETFVAIGSPATVAAELHRRYGGLVDRLGFATQDGSEVPTELLVELRGGAAPDR
jgi:probable F420-dependent oxidoreductase